MASKPSNLARWAETGGGTPAANITEPASGQKDTGWTNGQQPPSSYFNWWMTTIYAWIKYLDDLVNQAFTWTALHTFQKGVVASKSTAGGRVADVSATGIQEGLHIYSDASGSNAVLVIENSSQDIGIDVGAGSGTAPGIQVHDSAGSGPAIKAMSTVGGAAIRAEGHAAGIVIDADASSGSNYAGKFKGNATKSPLNLVPQGAPSSLADGDIWVETGSNTVKIRVNGVTKTVTLT